jgi:hypothetical protein
MRSPADLHDHHRQKDMVFDALDRFFAARNPS